MEKQRAKQVGGRVRQQGWVMRTAGARMAVGGCALCVALSAGAQGVSSAHEVQARCLAVEGQASLSACCFNAPKRLPSLLPHPPLFPPPHLPQTAFITYAFGGSPSYSGRSLLASHRKLMEEKGLGLAHFDAVAGHLVQTMKDVGVDQALVDEAAAVVMSTRSVFDPAQNGVVVKV